MNKIKKEEIQKNIDYWENEVQKALLENNINKAVGCRILADKLRENLKSELLGGE